MIYCKEVLRNNTTMIIYTLKQTLRDIATIGFSSKLSLIFLYYKIKLFSHMVNTKKLHYLATI